MKINFEKGLKRIYIVLSVLWAIFWVFVAITDKSFIPALIGVVLPIFVYFILDWIIKGFKE